MRNVTVDYKFAITAAWDAVHNNYIDYIQKSQECIFACSGPPYCNMARAPGARWRAAAVAVMLVRGGSHADRSTLRVRLASGEASGGQTHWLGLHTDGVVSVWREPHPSVDPKKNGESGGATCSASMVSAQPKFS